jgi:tRNA threonylcarbamoyladenosine biosynthesis protein TsaE
MRSLSVNSVDEIPEAAIWLLAQAGAKKVIAFYGNMGAGKTTLIKQICSLLHCQIVATSPTFAIINEYPVADSGPVFHFDFYRINSQKELVDIGLEEYLFSGHYCLLEWPQIAEPMFPPAVLKVEIMVTGENTREIRILNEA